MIFAKPPGGLDCCVLSEDMSHAMRPEKVKLHCFSLFGDLVVCYFVKANLLGVFCTNLKYFFFLSYVVFFFWLFDIGNVPKKLHLLF